MHPLHPNEMQSVAAELMMKRQYADAYQLARIMVGRAIETQDNNFLWWLGFRSAAHMVSDH